jgi:hypothetical protein
MTTDELEHAMAFAASETHAGDLRVILAQAKAACRTMAKEIERLRDESAGLEDVAKRTYLENERRTTEIAHLKAETAALLARGAAAQEFEPTKFKCPKCGCSHWGTVTTLDLSASGIVCCHNDNPPCDWQGRRDECGLAKKGTDE